jgi:N-acetylneuraminic acid mutarotase
VAILATAVVALGTLSLGQGAGTWTRAAPLPSSRTEVTGAELGGRLYVIGGFGQSGDRVEAYDPRKDRWEVRAPLPVPLHHAAAVSLGARLYVVGGYAGGQWAVQDSVFEYDPSADRWRTRAALPTARGALAAAVLDGRIYAAGGVGANRRNTDALEVYDPSADRWEPRAAMPVPRDHHAAGVVAGKLRVVGGRLEGSYARNLDAHHVYDPATNSWTPDGAKRHRHRGPRDAALRLRRRGALGHVRPGGGLRHGHERLDLAHPDADPPPRADGHSVRGADSRALGRSAARRLLQCGPRGAESLRATPAAGQPPRRASARSSGARQQ